MKTEVTPYTPKFNPVTLSITIESEAELKAITALFALDVTIPAEVVKHMYNRGEFQVSHQDLHFRPEFNMIANLMASAHNQLKDVK